MERKDELAKYLGFPFVLPTKKLAPATYYTSRRLIEFFNRLKDSEERFASRGIFPFSVLSIKLIFLKVEQH